MLLFPGDPEGGARARQEWRDGCRRHHPKERLLYRGAQSQETLIDRTEKGINKKKKEGEIGEIHLKETASYLIHPHFAWHLSP